MPRVRDRDLDIMMDVQRHVIRVSQKNQLSRFSKSMPSIAHTGQPLSVRSESTTSLSTIASSSRRRKFHRCFSQIPTDERIVNHYRCALVRDMLLQGHLYITPNYFAFYSNVFGYVTRLIIPIASIIDVNKQKAVKIIPNAIAVTTKEGKHVFGSLFWKDSTSKQIRLIWEDLRYSTNAAAEEQHLVSEERVHNSEDNLDENDSSPFESETNSTSRSATTIADTDGSSADILTRLHRYFKSSTIIAILVVLLAVLFVSAAVMMKRIDRLHAAYLNHPLVSPDHSIKLHLSEYLQRNLHHVVQLRQSLQIMSQHFGSVVGGVSGLEDTPS